MSPLVSLKWSISLYFFANLTLILEDLTPYNTELAMVLILPTKSSPLKHQLALGFKCFAQRHR